MCGRELQGKRLLGNIGVFDRIILKGLLRIQGEGNKSA
jgi:hypothetical protein